jgi:hypothetical protein
MPRLPGEKSTRKQRVTAWVKPQIAETLAAMAGAQRLTVSEVAANLLEHSITQESEQIGSSLILPAVERQIQKTGRYIADRLANLLARSALDAASSRRLLFQLLAREFGEEKARQMYESSWNGAISSLRKPSAGVKELLGVDNDPNSGQGELQAGSGQSGV